MVNKLQAFVLTIALLFGGCSVKLPSYKEVKVRGDLSSIKEKKLAKAFMEYWRARVRGDYKTSYRYELPYQRYILDYDSYRKKIGNIYPKAKVILVKIDYLSPNVAIISRDVKFKKKIYHKKDKWIYVDGKWYHKFYQNILPSLEDAQYQ
jgi:hypothetical protein